MTKRHALFFVFVVLLAGCATAPITGAQWTESEARFFDNGIDVLADLSKLSGQYAFEAKEELNARSNVADLVAIVSIESVQSSKDESGLEGKRIQVKVIRKLYGESELKSITLVTNQESLGFHLIERYEDQLNGNQLMFLRWYQDEQGLFHGFHLSPDSDAMVSEAKLLIEKRIEEEEKLAKQQNR